MATALQVPLQPRTTEASARQPNASCGDSELADAETDEYNWRSKTGNALQGKPFVTDDTIYFGSNDITIYALERQE